MAADVQSLFFSNNWNIARPVDVNADGSLNAIDALVIINELNGAGPRALSGTTLTPTLSSATYVDQAFNPGPEGLAAAEGEDGAVPGDSGMFYDVNNDGYLNPLDALVVINALNGEGEPTPPPMVRYAVVPVVQGTNTPLTTVPEGGFFEVRVLIQDLGVLMYSGQTRERFFPSPPNPPNQSFLGAFSGFIDVNWDTAQAKVQVNEIQSVRINGSPSNATTFRLTVNGQQTANIAFNADDPTVTAANIRAALIAKFPNNAQGLSNFQVTGDFSDPTAFAVRFLNGLSNVDQTPMTGQIVNAGGATTISVSELQSGNPANSFSFAEAFAPREVRNASNNPINTPLFYVNQLVALPSPTGVDELGGFASDVRPRPGEVVRELSRFRVNAVEALDTGIVSFGGNINTVDLLNHPTSLFGFNTAILKGLIAVDAAANVTITEVVSARNASGTVAEFTSEGTATQVVITPTTIGTNARVINSVTPPANGIVTFSGTTANRTVTYKPNKNFTGTDTFTYTVRDGANFDTGTITVTVTAVNDRPQNTVPGTQTVDEDTELTFTGANAISIADIDAGNADVQVTLAATNGVLNLASTSGLMVTGNGSGTVTAKGTVANINLGLNGLKYKPADNFSGNAQLTVTTSDLGATGSGGALVDSDIVSITVRAMNDAPINTVPASPVNVDENVPLAFTGNNLITISDIDAGTGTMTVVLTTNATSGGVLSATGSAAVASNGGRVLTITGNLTVVNNALATLSYVNSVAPFTDTLTVTTSDNGNTSAVGSPDPKTTVSTVTINVVATVRPRAIPDVFSRLETDTGTFDMDVLHEGVDDLVNTGANVKARLLSVSPLLTGEGSVQIVDVGVIGDNTDDIVRYTPSGDTDFFGQVTFNYTMRDTTGMGMDSTALVTINIANVNDPAVANPDMFPATEDTPLNIPVPGLLGNDTDVDNDFGQVVDTLTVVIDTPPLASQGSLNLNANGSFMFTPALNFNGAATFTYRVSDGHVLSAPATVTINVAAVNDEPVAVNDAYTTTEEGVLTIPNMMSPTGVLGNDTDVEGQTLTAVLTAGSLSPAGAGTLSLAADGSFEFNPALNFNGTATFKYRANDGAASSLNEATVTITVIPVNDAPIATAANYSGTEDQLLSVPAATGLRTKVTDVDSANLTVEVVTAPNPTTEGTLTLNANGSFTFLPVNDFTGNVTFTYRASDGQDFSNEATVTLSILAVNDPPTADNDAFSTAEDDVLTVPGPGVLDGDNDPEGFILTATLVTDSSDGDVVLNSDGSFIFTPTPHFNGTTSFTYRVSDGSNNSNIATVTITVTPKNDAPVANADTFQAIKHDPPTQNFPGQLVTPSPVANDNDGFDTGETLTITSVSATSAQGGTVTLVGQQIFYTPAVGFEGSDSFTYTISDNNSGTSGPGGALTAVGTVNVTVVNFLPTNIGGTVYIDAAEQGAAQGDGQIDAGEKRVGHVGVRLAGTDFQNNVITPLVVFTDINGNYLFEGVKPGNYTLTQIQPDYLLDGKDTVGGSFATKPAGSNDTFNITLPLLGIPGGAMGNNFGELGVNTASLSDSSGFIAEMTSLTGPNGMVMATDLQGNVAWSWCLPGWDNVASATLTLEGTNLAHATLRVTDLRGTLHTIRIHQNPSKNTEAYYPANSQARFRVLGTSASGDYIIRLDGAATEFGLNLQAAVALPADQGEGEAPMSDRAFSQAADAVFAEESWA